MTPIACFDLDNTLIDRDAAFAAWASWWAGNERLEADAVSWLLAKDEGGFRPRAELFAEVKEQFGLTASVEDLVAAYDREHPLFTSVDQAVLDGLTSLRTAGWRVAVVTNGGTVQQTLKLEHTGIGPAVDCCCISEEVGVRKPDRAIFGLAADRCGATLVGGWMVGDHPAYDIAGGIAAGLRTILVGDRRPAAGGLAPDHHLSSVLGAFPVILAG
ncbi:putative hydrolase of the HAD superfamily [Kribbella voronezhensis]|uniref:Putative hydrolase of the HAD superfamily n=1 Tax=Kribbella voronezhensis TaxID=2512212 RepID=A0A4R7SYC7_9ACTN|nr:HAD family hydrolase [Kribbella voronezhensis]TDU84392.1 putative hydrolase of the HAD superfamily [Kribbella voronezhensis]